VRANSHIDAELAERLQNASEDADESHAEDCNSYGAGYDAGYRDALKRALCIVRGLDSDD
jgi:hypothetical protein